MKSILKKFIHLYQKTRGIRKYLWIYLFGYSRVCPHYPTCSDYARQSIENYGVMRGGTMGLWRILRCRG